MLAISSDILYKNINNLPWLPGVLLLLLICITPIWGIVARINKFTRKVIITGWFPILLAMLFQNFGGLIMKKALDHFEKLAVFQPVLNGKIHLINT